MGKSMLLSVEPTTVKCYIYSPMEERGANILLFMNTSPVFKGLSVIIAGLIALLFWYYMKKRWGEPDSFGYKAFFYFSVFVVLYGLYILMFRPDWWALPY
jgi:hypothetical protein